MTFDELTAAVAEVDKLFSQRVEVWRVLIGRNGKPTGRRLYSGFFYDTPAATKQQEQASKTRPDNDADQGGKP